MTAAIENSAYRAIAPLSGLPKTRVFMADDNPAEHLLMAMAADQSAQPLQFEFETSGDGLLLELGAAPSVGHYPDLILLDYDILGLSGAQTLEELQAHPSLWQIPVVVLTDSYRIEDEVGAYQRGACWFELRPESMSAMIGFVSRVIGFARRTGYEEPQTKIVRDRFEIPFERFRRADSRLDA